MYLKISSQDGSSSVQINFAEHINRYRSYINTSLNECLIPFRIEISGIDTNIDIELPEWMIEKITPEY